MKSTGKGEYPCSFTMGYVVDKCPTHETQADGNKEAVYVFWRPQGKLYRDMNDVIIFCPLTIPRFLLRFSKKIVSALCLIGNSDFSPLSSPGFVTRRNRGMVDRAKNDHILYYHNNCFGILSLNHPVWKVLVYTLWPS